ncbi:MAG: hypothetical protein C4520_08210 [Candidatus Abyssobacteria bacterium SURF_5]|uniref:YhaN AAA domain-containing protein n=1 Tax=Abyssobacteria bacterium (strain SURF_5) TaxID=2093360 RepID=A0A3A4NV91_ABYX5|nr:MAG: hypothetical protein C4520_08210 [Candidatus Abyssubacteria bacterium SURF_5]
MRISALSIDGFGLFGGRFECDFPDGIALVVGDNESGKSTIVSAIGAILFGFGTESEKALFAPVLGVGPRSGSLEVVSQGKCYRFSRDFGTNRTKVELLENNGNVLFDGVARQAGRSDEKERYNRILNMVFGIESRDLFYSSIFVEQGKLPAKMDTVVRRIVSGSSSADYAVVLKNLRESCEDLTISVPWGRSASRKPRQIELLDQEIRSKRILLEESHSASTSLRELRGRLYSLEQKLKQVEQTITEKTTWEKNLEAFRAALERKTHTEENLRRCRKTKDEIERLQGQKEKLDSEIRAGYAEYLDLPETAEKDLFDLSLLDRSIVELQQRRRQCIQIRPAFRPARFAPATVAAGCLLAAFGILFFEGRAAVVAVVFGLAAATVPFLFAAVTLYLKRSAHQVKLNEIDDQLRRLMQQQEEQRKLYPALPTGDIGEILDRLRSLRRLVSEREKREEALKQHPPNEDVEAEYDRLSNDLITLNHEIKRLQEEYPRLADIERDAGIGSFLDKARTERKKAEVSLQDLMRERDDARYQLAALETREAMSEEALEEEIVESEARLARLKLHRSAYLQAVEVLEEVISEFRSSHLARIQEKAAEYLTTITGKECQVCLDEGLKPLYLEREEQRLVPEQLSQGAQDQLGFTLRLSAIDEMCGNIRLPIILDDPFVNFDEKRLDAVQKMLEKLSSLHQIILLTHDKRYCAWRPPSLVLENNVDSQ